MAKMYTGPKRPIYDADGKELVGVDTTRNRYGVHGYTNHREKCIMCGLLGRAHRFPDLCSECYRKCEHGYKAHKADLIRKHPELADVPEHIFHEAWVEFEIACGLLDKGVSRETVNEILSDTVKSLYERGEHFRSATAEQNRKAREVPLTPTDALKNFDF